MTTLKDTTTPGSGTWRCPAGITDVLVECWGGGGGGGAGLAIVDGGPGSAGGGGGEYAAETVTVTPGTTYAYTVGAGGAGGMAGGGGNGGNSTFDSTTVVAHGGGGGPAGSPGAAGGSGSSNTTHHSGGSGFDGLFVGSVGGGGGGSGGTGGAGNNATSATGATAVAGGGPGGNGTTVSGVNGSSPVSGPGGGGGAGRAGTDDGGAGANGRVLITSSQTPIPEPKIPRVDLFIDRAWTDVSSYVLYESGISATRGKRSESGGMEAQTAQLTFKNFAPDYPFTPDHPLSINYGKLGRNTPIRFARDAATVDDTETTYLYLSGSQGAYARAVDSAGLSITGDIDIRLDVALDDWTVDQDLASKYRSDIGDRSWAVNISAGIIQYVWSADGATTSNAFSTSAISAGVGERVAIRVTHDVNNGAAGNDVKFWTSDSISGTWTQLGSTVTASGTTSIYDSLADVVVGDIPTSGLAPMAGKVYGFQLLSGIGGTTKASPDFTAQDEITNSFADAQANTWELNGAAQMVTTTPGPWRFHGEVSEWPVVSDRSGKLVTVSIEAAGQWRRLSQNEQPLNSVMFRAHTAPTLSTVKAYWSLEDGSEATQAASNYIGNGYPMQVSGSPTFADYDSWTSSGPMLTLGSASLTGRVFPYAATGESGVYFFFITPTAGAPAAETSLFTVTTTGTARTFDVRLLTNGSLRLKAYDDDGNAIDDGAGSLDSELTFDLFPRGFLIMHLELLQSGSDVVWYVAINDFTNTDLADGALGSTFFSGTITGKTFGIIRSVVINGQKAALPQTHISHLAVSDQFKLKLADVGDAVNAYNGENPVTRLLRIGGEEDVPIDAVITGSANSVSMGDQLPKTLTALFTETADTDLGILHESRDRLALRYRTRLSLANQAAAATLSHASHELGETLKPTNDDQLTVNEQYVIRDKGIKAYRAKTSGKISNLSPMAGGVGRYPAEKTVNVTYDQQVADQAGFRLFLGTRDKPRYPQVTVNLHHPSIAGTQLETDLLALDIGDRLVVTDMPDYLPPDDADILVVGYAERFDQFRHTITFVGTPYEPWQWAVADDTDKRADTAGSTTTAAFVSGTDTGMTAFTSSGPLWTTKAASLPFNIRCSGAELTVTAVTSAAVDAFGRTTSNGWGSPDVGPAWTTAAGSASDFAVGSGAGTHTVTSAGAGRWSTVDVESTDVDVYGSVATGALATGGSLHGYLLGRFADTSNMYIARAEFTTTQTVIFTLRKIVAGSDTQLVTAGAVSGLTHAAGTFFRMRLQVVGSTLRGKIWLASLQEPGAWTLTTTDTTLTGGTQAGFRSFRASANTNVNPVFSYDDFEVINPQTLTITQTPVNGVAKTIPSGSDINVANPAYIGLV